MQHNSQKAIPYWNKVRDFAQRNKLPFFTNSNLIDSAIVYEIEKQIPLTVVKIEKIITSCKTIDHITSALQIICRFEKMFTRLKTITDIPMITGMIRKYAYQKQGEIMLYNYGWNQYYNDSSIHPEWTSGINTDEGPE